MCRNDGPRRIGWPRELLGVTTLAMYQLGFVRHTVPSTLALNKAGQCDLGTFGGDNGRLRGPAGPHIQHRRPRLGWQPAFEVAGLCEDLPDPLPRALQGVRVTVNALIGILPVVGVAGSQDDGA